MQLTLQSKTELNQLCLFVRPPYLSLSFSAKLLAVSLPDQDDERVAWRQGFEPGRALQDFEGVCCCPSCFINSVFRFQSVKAVGSARL